jgi:shikimate dehydrogenase
VLANAVRGMRTIENLAGIIVTIPHKIAIRELCDDLTSTARGIGAVNIVRRDRDGRLLGANFDGAGMVSALAAELGSVIARRVYMAGAGGVARAIAFTLAEAGVARLAIHNRSSAKADALIDAIKRCYPKLDVLRGDGHPRDFDIAINATSVGLEGEHGLPFAVDALPATAAVAEVVMNPLITPLLARAEARGLRTVKGDAMLHRQFAAWIEFLALQTERT